MNTKKANSNLSSYQESPNPQFDGAMRVLAIAGAAGAIVIIAYAAQAQSWSSIFSAAASGLIIAGASLVLGGLIGFLFGIPKTLQTKERPRENEKEETPGEKNKSSALPYVSNTNLEEISDWLTKILVGVGLTQLITLPAKLQNVGQLLAPAFGNFPSSSVFAIGVLIYFALCGFFMGYLWVRLVLPKLQIQTDLESAAALAEKEGYKMGDEGFLDKINRALAVSEPVKSVDGALALETPSARYALWVDDRPENNERERALLETVLKLKFTNVLDTDAALDEMGKDRKKYRVVISDMGRPPDPRAGYTLLDRMRNEGFMHPYIIYSFSARTDRG